MCVVYLTEEDKIENIPCEHLEPVQPEKGDKVSGFNYFLNLCIIISILNLTLMCCDDLLS